MTNEEKAKRIKKMIGEDKDHGRPADIIADIMHYCKFYTDIEDSEMYHDFEYEFVFANSLACSISSDVQFLVFILSLSI